jgi:hypothetical protein
MFSTIAFIQNLANRSNTQKQSSCVQRKGTYRRLTTESIIASAHPQPSVVPRSSFPTAYVHSRCNTPQRRPQSHWNFLGTTTLIRIYQVLNHIQSIRSTLQTGSDESRQPRPCRPGAPATRVTSQLSARITSGAPEVMASQIEGGRNQRRRPRPSRLVA